MDWTDKVLIVISNCDVVVAIIQSTSLDTLDHDTTTNIVPQLLFKVHTDLADFVDPRLDNAAWRRSSL